MDEQFFTETVKYTYQVLTQHPKYLMSWGVVEMKGIIYNEMASVLFTVNGFLHKGDVIVAYNGGTDYFEVYLLDKDRKVVGSSVDICFEELVSTIDQMVETKVEDADYYAKINNWMNETNL